MSDSEKVTSGATGLEDVSSSEDEDNQTTTTQSQSQSGLNELDVSSSSEDEEDLGASSSGKKKFANTATAGIFGDDDDDDLSDQGANNDSANLKEEEIKTEVLNFPRIDSIDNENLYYVRMPRLVEINKHPFTEEQYRDEGENSAYDGYEMKTKGEMIRLKVQNTVRWRLVEEEGGGGQKKMESNTQIIRWDDGSMSLQLGEELFDITEKDITRQNYQLGASVGDGVLCEALLKQKLGFRPVSLDSKTHQKMKQSINEKFAKKSKIKTYETDKDPEKLKEAQIKMAEERIRANAKRGNQQRRLMEASHRKPLNRSYLEGDYGYEDDEDGYENSLNAIKEMSGYSRKRPAASSRSQQQSRSNKPSYFREERHEEEDEQKIMDAKNLDIDDDFDDFDVEDDELPGGAPSSAKKRKGNMVDSDSD
eukprot:Nk52_evm1s1952 gene=Nk52_evmTU1s1952